MEILANSFVVFSVILLVLVAFVKWTVVQQVHKIRGGEGGTVVVYLGVSQYPSPTLPYTIN